MKYKKYQYVGPLEIAIAAKTQPSGTQIRSKDELTNWLKGSPTEQRTDGLSVATFSIGLDLELRLAPRRSEHVACASGQSILSAGELVIDDNYDVVETSNQSTGYCPEPDSWAAVEAAFDQIGLNHPGRFTCEVIFRRCQKCGERNIVKDSWYYCMICSSELSRTWNF